MKYGSLRLRLLITWAVFIAVTLPLSGVGLRLIFERAIARRTQVELEADLRQLRRGMELTSDGQIRIARAPTDPQFDIVFGGRYWQIEEGGIVILRSPSLNAAKLKMPDDLVPSTSAQTAKMLGPEDQHLLAVIRQHHITQNDADAQRELTIVTAVDALEIEEDTNKFSHDLFIGLLGLAGLLLFGAWAHISIVLRPLEDIRAKVAAVRKGATSSLDGRFPDEVMPLISETNALLDAQHSAIRAARARASDLAHGLNTPLAIMRAKSRELQRKGECEIAQEIENQIEKLRRHVDRELARTRARGASVGWQPAVDSAQLLRGLVSAVQCLPRGVDLAWVIAIPETLMLNVDADDFNNIAGNLIENAMKWARAEVRIHARTQGKRVVLTVEDDGPGIPDDQIERVKLRGERADESVEGSGLGLAIVSDLVGLNQGEFQLSRSMTGGLKAEVIFPAEA